MVTSGTNIQKIFDPLGILCPVTLPPKIIVHHTWTLKIGWDTELPEIYRKEFETWYDDLSLLNDIKIPRCLGMSDLKTEFSIHVFCGASKLAYSTVIFLRKVQEEKVSLHFIQAKSRVAPLHKMTIPRLELLAYCIGARLSSITIKAMDLKEVPIIYWTDSSTALCWINREENWGVFINNRVKEIRSLTEKNSLRHLPGEQNPADLSSRGCSAKVFLK
ncbi:uncharacterized protein [Parasteatoda tepidariorum]|uniref:uncharacterized protein n=1 Tax=Parasteatoda tepidariorum TaxID=114398 RepID=UPI0039BD11C5